MLQCHVSSQTVVEILKSCQYEPHTTLMTSPRYRELTAPYYTQILSNDMWDVELLNQRKCPINYLPRHNRDDGHSILTLNTVKNHSGPLTRPTTTVSAVWQKRNETATSLTLRDYLQIIRKLWCWTLVWRAADFNNYIQVGTSCYGSLTSRRRALLLVLYNVTFI